MERCNVDPQDEDGRRTGAIRRKMNDGRRKGR